MKEFLMKEVRKTTEDGLFDVIRTRTSNGFASITIRSNGDEERSFNFTNENDNNGYEMQALELAETLRDVAENPCKLPTERKE